MLRWVPAACRLSRLMGGCSIALGVTACSLLLDWNGYTGGETGGKTDASLDAGDAAERPDARIVPDAADLDAREGGDAADVQVVEAAPRCGPLNCGGCCNGDFCYGGGSQKTCGTGGEACQDCMAQGGKSCVEGACSTAEAGPPPVCDELKCTAMLSLCPGYSTPCCLSDGTCGCQSLLGRCM